MLIPEGVVAPPYLLKIDYSQLSKFHFCPWGWYENYVRGMQPRYVGQRSDALALGSLVHNGLDNFGRTGKLLIDSTTVSEVNPTTECYQLAELLVAGYIRKYPAERWVMEHMEAAVEFPLLNTLWRGIAKLDRYFFVEEDTTIDAGLPGQTLTLGRGWWSQEFKTKAHGIPRNTWMKEWASKRQADFQLLALIDLLDHYPHSERYTNSSTDTVRGVLVSVLEKPREYTPMRKCKGCGVSYELASYLVSAAGHICPMCSHVQILSPYKPTVPSNPEFFRMIVTRTPHQLEEARYEISQAAEQMDAMAQEGMHHTPPHRDNCITNRWHRQCEYAEQHISGNRVAEPTFIHVDPYKYIGLPV